MENSRRCSLTTRWSILSPTTIITNRRPTFHLQILTLPRIQPSMMKLTSSVFPLQWHWWRGEMWSSLPVFPAFMDWVTRWIIRTWWSPFVPEWSKTGMRWWQNWLRSSMTAMIWIFTVVHSGCAEMCWRSFRLTRAIRRSVWNFSGMRLTGFQRLIFWLAKLRMNWSILQSFRLLTMLLTARTLSVLWQILRKSWKNGWKSLSGMINCWRHSVSQSGRILILRCSKRQGFVPESRIIPGICQD